MSITVVSIGTGGPDCLTLGAVAALERADARVLRTERHPVAAWLTERGLGFTSLDALYEQSEDFDAFNRAAAAHLLGMRGDIAYAVGDAAFDTTVAALQALAGDTKIIVLPGVSHADRCLAMIPNKPAGVRLYATEQFRAARVSPEEPLLLCELHSRECAGDCKLRLMELRSPEQIVSFVMGDEAGALTRREIALCELDRQERYDHLTAVYVPAAPMLARERFDMDDLCAVMRRLRGPDGCPWDKEQTHETLLTNLLEECYEFIDAARQNDTDHMYDELGDVLLQVVFHAEIARQHGEFDILDVTTAICRKMIERHTHIFGSAKCATAADVLDNWEAIKRKQRGITTTAQAMEDVSKGLSPAMRASKVQHKAAKVGFDFASAADALDKVREEADEVAACVESGENLEMELGDLFFSAVNVCRLCGKNPDIALTNSTDKFIRRFRSMENSINSAGKRAKDLTLSEMDVYWEAGKQTEAPFVLNERE